MACVHTCVYRRPRGGSPVADRDDRHRPAALPAHLQTTRSRGLFVVVGHGTLGRALDATGARPRSCSSPEHEARAHTDPRFSDAPPPELRAHVPPETADQLRRQRNRGHKKGPPRAVGAGVAARRNAPENWRHAPPARPEARWLGPPHISLLSDVPAVQVPQRMEILKLVPGVRSPSCFRCALDAQATWCLYSP